VDEIGKGSVTSRGEVDLAAASGLYSPAHEHDACGVGFVAHIAGRKSHAIVEQGLKILENLNHRGAVGADRLMGDGAGILIQIPDDYFRAEMAAQGIELPAPGEEPQRHHHRGRGRQRDDEPVDGLPGIRA